MRVFRLELKNRWILRVVGVQAAFLGFGLPEKLSAQLLFARYAVAVAVHFCSGAVPQKPRRFFARGHLRTMRSAVAAVFGRIGRCGKWCGFRRVRLFGRKFGGGKLINLITDEAEKYQRYTACQQAAE